MKSAGYLIFAYLFLFGISCTNEIAREGFVNVEGGKVWYKIIGKGDATPLLILLGGPGSRSCL